MNHPYKLILFFLFITSLLSAQNSIKIELLQTVFSATDGTGSTKGSLGLAFYYERGINERSSFQIGLSIARISSERTIVDHPSLGNPIDYERSFWGLSIIPTYRFYFKRRKEGALSKGFFLSLYGKIIPSKVYTIDYLTDKKEVEMGYTVGMGIGLGYKFRINHWSIEPFFGMEKDIVPTKMYLIQEDWISISSAPIY